MDFMDYAFGLFMFAIALFIIGSGVIAGYTWYHSSVPKGFVSMCSRQEGMDEESCTQIYYYGKQESNNNVSLEVV